MLKIFSNPSQIITIDTGGENLKRGKRLKDINVLSGYSILVENEKIKDFIPNESVYKYSPYQKINLEDKIILPGLVDCHTHTVFSGSRANEFREKLNGKSYEEIAASGGGISNTVESVRKTSFNKLIKIAGKRIEYFISQGVTSLEIKSGYGLDFESEIKILEVIKKLNKIYPIDIVPTFLGAHTIPNEYKSNRAEYISLIIEEMLPFVAKNNLAEFCDGFCESTAFSAEEIDLIFSSAKKHNLNLKLHADQFNSIGGLDIALKHNVTSADHLEVINESDIKKISNSEIVCVLLPGVSFFLNYNYAPARKLIENNVIVALASDFNPGSSHIYGLNFIMSLAALKMGMTIEETISAVTINSAKALKMNNKIGSLEINKSADFAVFDTTDYADIVYSIGKNLNYMTVKNGEIIYKSGIS